MAKPPSEPSPFESSAFSLTYGRMFNGRLELRHGPTTDHPACIDNGGRG